MKQVEQKKITIGIRVDGNEKIGMGHLMRCLSVAEALQSVSVPAVFFTAQENSGEIIRREGFPCEVLESDYTAMDGEIPRLLAGMKKWETDLLLTDSYQVTEEYLKAIRQYCPVFYMDDMGTEIFPVSGIINYNIYGKNLEYEKKYGQDTVLLLGPYYAPIRREFSQMDYKVRPGVENILLTMGGSDSLNIAGTLGKRLLEHVDKKIRVEVICGRFNPHYQELLACSKTESRLHILTDVTDMWNKIAEADIVIAAAGSTMYEVSAVGVPAICCYYVENQRQIAEGFAHSTGIENAGNYTEEAESCIQRILEEVRRLICDYNRRLELSGNIKKVTDGLGAYYLAEQLRQYAMGERSADETSS